MTKPDQTVIVVDDDPSLRQSIDSLLRSVGYAVQSYTSAAEFLRAEQPPRPACLILDVRLPEISGLQFQSEMAKSGIDLPVVFITGHGDVAMSVAAMKAGAIEFLTKPFRDQDLLDAVHLAMERDKARHAEELSLREMRDRFQSLSPREFEVLDRVVAGQMNKQVAGALGLSEVTVKAHRASVMAKLGATSLPDLVRMADLHARTTRQK